MRQGNIFHSVRCNIVEAKQRFHTFTFTMSKLKIVGKEAMSLLFDIGTYPQSLEKNTPNTLTLYHNFPPTMFIQVTTLKIFEQFSTHHVYSGPHVYQGHKSKHNNSSKKLQRQIGVGFLLLHVIVIVLALVSLIGHIFSSGLAMEESICFTDIKFYDSKNSKCPTVKFGIEI